MWKGLGGGGRGAKVLLENSYIFFPVAKGTISIFFLKDSFRKAQKLFKLNLYYHSLFKTVQYLIQRDCS